MEKDSRNQVEASQDRNIMHRESGNLMEMVRLEVCLQSIVGCMAGKLVLVVGGEGQVLTSGLFMSSRKGQQLEVVKASCQEPLQGHGRRQRLGIGKG